MAQVICEYCGGLNDDRSTNCSKCGAPLPTAPPAAPQSPPGPPQQQPAAPAPQPYRFQTGPPPPKPRGPAAGCAIVGCVLLAVFAMLFIVGVFSAVKSVDTSKSPAPKTPAPAVHAVVSLHGSAGTTTRAFDVSREWDLDWSYNCANLGRPGSFAVTIHLIGAPTLLDRSFERTGPSGAGRAHVISGGTYRVTVKSRCRWGIKALDHG